MKKVKPSQLGSVLKGLSEMAGKDFADVLRKLSIDAYTNLIRISAVDTGYMRGNWEATVDTIPPNESHSGSSKKKYKPSSIPSFINIKIGSNVIIFNNSFYAIHVDQGTEKQRAQPMIEPTRIRIEAEAVKVSKALSKVVYNV